MAQLTRETVQEQLYRLHLRFKDRNYTTSQLEILTDEYFEDFSRMGWSEENFIAAIRLAKERATRFLAVAEIVAVHEEICRNPPKPKVDGYLAEESLVRTPEKMAQGKNNCQVLRQLMVGEISEEEAKKKIIFVDN